MKKSRLTELYEKLPSIDCQGHCHTSCGPIVVGPTEKRVIRDEHGESSLPKPKQDLTCNQLDKDNRCSIYNERPLICRLYGLTKKLRCDYGCEPDEWLSERRARELMDEIINEKPKTNFTKHLNK